MGNRELRLQGQAEFPLTERGRRQAEELAASLAERQVIAVYSSPIRRALDTAEAIASPLGLTVEVQAALQEYDFGKLSGLTWPEIREQRPQLIEQLLSDSADYPEYPGEEGREPFRQRVCKALWGISERHAEEESVAVVTHAGPVAVFLLDVLHRGYHRPMPFTLDNASVTTVEIAEPQPVRPRAVLVGLNDTCHLATV
ncbi:MAG: histidine phosphatase family protein [Chloroflexi bacterium]|nr:histidine phosphatase family protein [Chloroflexota bacterium]